MIHLAFSLLIQDALLTTAVITPAKQELDACNLQETERITIQGETHFGLDNPNTPVPVQTGCCVLKQGDRRNWRYIDTTEGNCKETARQLRVPHSYYPGTACSDVRK